MARKKTRDQKIKITQKRTDVAVVGTFDSSLLEGVIRKKNNQKPATKTLTRESILPMPNQNLLSRYLVKSLGISLIILLCEFGLFVYLR